MEVATALYVINAVKIRQDFVWINTRFAFKSDHIIVLRFSRNKLNMRLGELK